MRRSIHAALVLMVAALHLAALWLLVIATRPHVRAADPVSRIAMVDVVPAPRVQADPSAPRTQAAPRTPISATRANAGRMPPDAVRIPAIPAPDVRPGLPAIPVTPAAPTPLILDSDGIRRALRDIGRESSVVERAHQDLDGHRHSAFDSRWSAGVAGAARGDCRKGEFKGSGMGLLSLPALALAAAKGDCGR